MPQNFQMPLTEERIAIFRSFQKYASNVGAIANNVGRTRTRVMEVCNELIEIGMLDDDGKPTPLGLDWLDLNKMAEEPEEEPKKKSVKTRRPGMKVKKTLTWKAGDAIHVVNLRCPKCRYFAKVTNEMLSYGRLKCPVEGEIMQTKEERGERRGRL